MLPQYQMSTPCFCSAINTGGSALKITCLMVDADYVRSRRTSIRAENLHNAKRTRRYCMGEFSTFSTREKVRVRDSEICKLETHFIDFSVG